MGCVKDPPSPYEALMRPVVAAQSRVFQVLVKTLTGTTLAFDVTDDDKIWYLAWDIWKATGIPIVQQKLIFQTQLQLGKCEQRKSVSSFKCF